MKAHLFKWYPLYVGVICGLMFPLLKAIGAALCIFLLVEMIKIIAGRYDNKDIA